MKVLLDTNIIIHREANSIKNEHIGMLFKWIDKLHYTKCVHPITVNELKKSINPNSVDTMQTKLQAYHLMATPAALHDSVKDISERLDTTENDKNDTILLNELYVGRVDVLVTEDKKIHKKAEALLVRDKVFHIEDFLEKLTSENPQFADYPVLSVRQEFFGNINLNDSFFDSFRKDYAGFDKWYNSKAGDNAVAYICKSRDTIVAFLYLKIEDIGTDYSDITPSFKPLRRLKIGTFKVVSNGIRLGERFIKIVFDNALLWKVEEIYVTIFDSRPELISLATLLEQFGFVQYGVKTSSSGSENVLVRNFKKAFDNSNPRKTFPWLSPEGSIYIVPIKPEYHTELFPDSILRTESPKDFVEGSPHRNSVSKSYVSRSPNRNLRSGDTLVFYRSGGMYKGVATTIGIVEDVFNPIHSLEELKDICHKRTVLSDEELKDTWNSSTFTRPFVINFLYAYSFKKRMNLKTMLDQGILPNMDSIITINEITRESFTNLIILSGL